MRPSTAGSGMVLTSSNAGVSAAPNSVAGMNSTKIKAQRMVVSLASLFLQRGMKRVEKFEALGQNLFVGQFQQREAFQHTIDAKAFGAFELPVFEVRVVDHFGDGLNGFVLDAEAL